MISLEEAAEMMLLAEQLGGSEPFPRARSSRCRRPTARVRLIGHRCVPSRDLARGEVARCPAQERRPIPGSSRRHPERRVQACDRDPDATPPALVCQVGKTELRYHARAIDDLHAMLKPHGDWMLLGSADEQKPAPDGTVEAWARCAEQPGGRLVRASQGLSWSLRHVHATVAGRTRPRRSRAQPAQQPHARTVEAIRLH